MWGGGKNSNDSDREIDSTEESTAGAAVIHIRLAPPRCSPDANGYCVQALAYAAFAGVAYETH